MKKLLIIVLLIVGCGGDGLIPFHFDDEMDCAGTPYGDAYLDSCGECSSGVTGHEADSDIDCAGVCFGYKKTWCDGTCSESGPIADCAGVCGGDAIADCKDVCQGPHVYDECGVCDGDGSSCIGEANTECC